MGRAGAHRQVYPQSRESHLKLHRRPPKGKVVTIPSQAALGSRSIHTHWYSSRTHSRAVKGYSLYSRQVSLTPDGTPVPRGTSTPSRVMLAEGSGVVLPKPVRWKGQALGIIGDV